MNKILRETLTTSSPFTARRKIEWGSAIAVALLALGLTALVIYSQNAHSAFASRVAHITGQVKNFLATSPGKYIISSAAAVLVAASGLFYFRNLSKESAKPQEAVVETEAKTAPTRVQIPPNFLFYYGSDCSSDEE